MKATPKTKRDLRRIRTELARLLKELEELQPELTETILIYPKDAFSEPASAVVELFIKRSDWFIKKLSDIDKIITFPRRPRK